MRVGELRAGRERRGVPRPVDRADAEPAPAVGAHELPERVQERRLRVGAQRHHLVLVGGAAEAEVGGQLLVEQPERVRQPLRGEHVQRAAREAPGQVGGHLAAPVEHEHAAGIKAGGEGGRGGVGDVVRDPPEVALPAAERRAQKQRRPPRVQRPQPLPVAGGDVRAGLRGQRRVIRVGDRVDVRRGQSRVVQAERDRLLRQLPGGEGDRCLAVLAPCEALLLGGGDGLAPHHESGGGVVEDGVDPENDSHVAAAFTEKRCSSNEGVRSSTVPYETRSICGSTAGAHSSKNRSCSGPIC